MTFHVRPLLDEDRIVLLDLADRLVIGVAPWRDREAVMKAVRGWVAESTGDAFEGVVLVAEVDGGVVGFISLSTTRHFGGETDGYIGELVVAEGYEGRGIGAALVGAAEREAKERGYRCLTLTTGAANQGAIDFYSRLGFEPEAIELTKVFSTK